MAHKRTAGRCAPWVTLLSAAALAAACAATAADLLVTSAAFVPDREFPELLKYFREGWSLTDELGQTRQYTQVVKQGAVAQAFVRNASGQPVEITSVLLNGIDLARQFSPRHQERHGLRACNFLLNDQTLTPPAVRERLEALGAPVWWMARPNPVPPGGFAQAVIRLRRMPTEKRLQVAVASADGQLAAAQLSPRKPARVALAYVGLRQGSRRALLYVRSGDGREFSVTSARVDGVEVKPDGPQTRDSLDGFLPIAIPLPEAWEQGTFHHVAVTTRDGLTAAAVVRARDPFFALGMWGYRNDGLTLEDMVRDCAGTFRDHLFNTHMGMAGAHTSYLRSSTGLDMLKTMGLRLMVSAPGEDDNGSPQLYARFLLDEPDCTDYRVEGIPYDRRIGSYAQALVERQREWTMKDPRTPTLLNVDMTFKPENWLTYGKLPDIFALDPYYQNRLRDAYWKHPGWLAQFCNPYYIHAVSEIARSACEPNPLHVILNSTSFRDKERKFRYGTPEEKRIEFYYALAAGAKGISYWWFTPYGAYRGCGALEPEAHAMLQEMARLNAEVRALQPLLATACPAAIPGEPDPFTTAQPAWLWARTLFAGTDAAVVILVNRDHASDRVGTVYQPIPKARVTFRVPPWMKAASAFRLSGGKFETVALTPEGDSVAIALQGFDLTDVLVISADDSLRVEAERRWRELQPKLEAVTAQTFDEYAAERNRAAEARAAERKRRREELFARYAPLKERLVEASDTLGTYGYETEDIWNPTGVKYNAQTWWVARGKVTPDIVKGLRWKPPRPGAYRVAINFVSGGRYRLRLIDAAGKALAERDVEPDFPRRPRVEEWTLDFPEGARLEFVELGGDARGEMWGRVSPLAYFVPAE